MNDESGIIDVRGRSLAELRESVQNDHLLRVLSRIADAETGQASGFSAAVD